MWMYSGFYPTPEYLHSRRPREKGRAGGTLSGRFMAIKHLRVTLPHMFFGCTLVSAGSPRSPGPLLDPGTFECNQILGSNNPEAPKDKTFGLLTRCRQIVSGQHKKTLLSMSAVFEHAQYPVSNLKRLLNCLKSVHLGYLV